MTYDVGLDRYRCDFNSAEKPCGRTYRYPSAAEHHYVNHTVAKVDVVLATDKFLVDPEVIGGDVLRMIVRRLESGVINVPELVLQLNGAALAMDWLHDELAKANVRSLRKKADAWDLIVEILAKDPGMVKVLADAAQ
jgi:hypothetical protein